MKYNPDIHHRRSVRLKGYDYTQPGSYFVTICTQDRAFLFGEVVDGEMRLNDAGAMVQSVWEEMPAFYPGVLTDAFVVMPNHIHGIVILVGAAPCGRPDNSAPCGHHDSGQAQGPAPTMWQPRGVGQPRGVAPTTSLVGTDPDFGQARGVGQAQGIGQAQGPAPTLSLADVVHRFKTLTTKRYADGVKRYGWPPFPGRLWQRNYYEHIIRNEQALNRIRQYIAGNPARWMWDRDNPDATHREEDDAWLP